jgi:hypothetical protein
VPRYFFTVGRSEREILLDPRGTLLPSIDAARLQAQRKIQKLRGQSGYDDPALIMQVKDETHRTILFLPFIPSD